MSLEVNQPGFNKAGYENVTTSDGIVHGQAKQSDAFSFVSGAPNDLGEAANSSRSGSMRVVMRYPSINLL